MADSTAPSAPLDAPIVAAVDGSSSSYHAVAWAAVDAALHRCRLHLITSVAIPTGFGRGITLPDAEIEWLRTDGERVVTEATRVARQAAPDDDLEISTEVTFDFIIPTLLARSEQARLVAVGSRGLGAFQRGLLGSVSTAVPRHAHCPVAVIHSLSAIDAVSASKPVLVGIDGSDNSVPATEVAFEEASRRKVGLVALHAWSDTSTIELPVAGWDGVRESEQAVLAESLAGWSERYPDVPARRIVVSDRPVRALYDESANAQLLVVGSHGRGGFAGMVLGSTSNALLHSVECPMIVVRCR
ncbi:universal stress protein [Nocardia sp. NPDC050710]|uniref:universal stress protein n=1 Tax=Nocardia sp. NPDC050710 TaxID=3157220 RepID=UPI0033D74B5D